MRLASRTNPRVWLPIAAFVTCLAPSPARADFLDDVRKTFTKDMPHFFQDDIPCAFGGQPTIHTKKSCPSSAPPAKAGTKAAPRARTRANRDHLVP